MRRPIDIFEEDLLNITLRQVYLAEDFPSVSLDHQVWQGPLLFSHSENQDVVSKRAIQAATLWLRNFDMRLFDELIIVHLALGFSVISHRALKRGEVGRIYGPVKTILQIENCLGVGETGFYFAERYRGKSYLYE